MSKHILSALALTIALPVTAIAQTAEAPSIMVSDAYFRSTNPAVAAGFMTLKNTGSADCVFSGLTVEGFEAPELHTHRDEQGVMKMVKVDSITVPAGGTHNLERGGDHVMLMKPAKPIEQGQPINAVLDFGVCGTVPLTSVIDNNAGPAENAAPAEGEHKHSH